MQDSHIIFVLNNHNTFKEDFMELWGMPISTSLAFYVLAGTFILAFLWTILGNKNGGKHE